MSNVLFELLEQDAKRSVLTRRQRAVIRTAANQVQEIERLRAVVTEQDEQIASLQAKVHLCTAYDRLEKERDEAVRLLHGALAEIEATGFAEGVFFGPDKQIDKKIKNFLASLKEIE